MKTAARIVLLVFVAFTFCECQIEPDSVLQQISKCEQKDSNDAVTACSDLDKAEACLKNIVLVDGWSKDDLQRAMGRVKKTRKTCTQNCLPMWIRYCKIHVQNDYAVSTEGPYNSVKHFCKTDLIADAYGCLDRFDAQCPDRKEMIRRERGSLEYMCPKPTSGS